MNRINENKCSLIVLALYANIMIHIINMKIVYGIY